MSEYINEDKLAEEVDIVNCFYSGHLKIIKREQFFMVFFVCLLFLTPMVIYFVKYSFNRMHTDNCSSLDPNATIVGIYSVPDNWGRYKHIKTVVRFSDGSEYHTYYTRREPGFGYTKISVDGGIIAEIKGKAIAAHNKKVIKEGILNKFPQEYTASHRQNDGYLLFNLANEKNNSDGSWVCKACGTKNEIKDLYCKDCEKYK